MLLPNRQATITFLKSVSSVFIFLLNKNVYLTNRRTSCPLLPGQIFLKPQGAFTAFVGTTYTHLFIH